MAHPPLVMNRYNRPYGVWTGTRHRADSLSSICTADEWSGKYDFELHTGIRPARIDGSRPPVNINELRKGDGYFNILGIDTHDGSPPESWYGSKLLGTGGEGSTALWEQRDGNGRITDVRVNECWTDEWINRSH